MPDSSALTPALRRSIVLLSLSNFASMSVQRICDAMLPALALEFSVSLAQAAQVVSFFAIAYGVALLVYGPLGDRVGKFRLISFCTLACCVGSIVSALAPDLATLVLGRILVALAAAAMIPMGLAWVGDAVSYERRQETLALLGLGSTLGLVSGQLLGGLFTDWFGWRWAFWFLTGLFGVVGTLQWRDWRQQRVRPHHMAGLAGQTGPRQSFGTQLLIILRRPHARAVLLTSVLNGALAFGVMAIWATHLHGRLGMSLAASGASVALARIFREASAGAAAGAARRAKRVDVAVPAVFQRRQGGCRRTTPLPPLLFNTPGTALGPLYGASACAALAKISRMG